MARIVRRPWWLRLSRRKWEYEWQVLVKSFMRPKCLERCLLSISHFYPETPVLVFDDSPVSSVRREVDLVCDRAGASLLPYEGPDRGLSYGRNRLVQESRARYVINCDDDWVFLPDTDIEAMLRPIQRRRLDLCAAVIRFDGLTPMNWSSDVTRSSDGRLQMRDPVSPWKHVGRVRYRRCDVVHNSFAASREVLLKNPWDPNIKIVHEHIDHFLTMKRGGVRVGYTTDSVIGHLPARSAEYAPWRDRDKSHSDYVLNKWGVTEMPVFLQRIEPGLKSQFILDSLPNHVLTDCQKPNLVLLAPGVDLTPIVSLLSSIGWHELDGDKVRAIDRDWMSHRKPVGERGWSGQALRGDLCEDLFSTATEPWVLHSSALALNLHKWEEWWNLQKAKRSKTPIVLVAIRSGQEDSPHKHAVPTFQMGDAQSALVRYVSWNGPKLSLTRQDLVALGAALGEGTRLQGDPVAVSGCTPGVQLPRSAT